MLTKLETFLWEQSDEQETSLRQAEGVVLALRRKLRDLDATLPIEYDGNAWMAVEEPYKR